MFMSRYRHLKSVGQKTKQSDGQKQKIPYDLLDSECNFSEFETL